MRRITSQLVSQFMLSSGISLIALYISLVTASSLSEVRRQLLSPASISQNPASYRDGKQANAQLSSAANCSRHVRRPDDPLEAPREAIVDRLAATGGDCGQQDEITFTNNHQSLGESSGGHHSRHYNSHQLGNGKLSSASALSNQYNKLLHTYSGSSHSANNPNLNYIHSLLAKPASSNLLSHNGQLSSAFGYQAAQGSHGPSSYYMAANSLQSQQPQQQQLRQYQPSPTQEQSNGSAQLAAGELAESSVCGRQQVGYREPRIVGGNSSYEGEFPWAVSIQRHGNHHCGGVIVGRRWILTAAHCVRSQSAGNLVVRTGGNALARSINSISSHLERDHLVEQIVMHDDFSRYDNLTASQLKSSANTNNADIALLRLKLDILWNELAWPVCLPSRHSGNFSGHEAVVVGWGKLNEKSEDFSNELQKVKLTIVDNRLCQNWFRQAGREMPIDERIICAGLKGGGKDACHGDSGGPLLSRVNGQYAVVGVVSTGIGCARPLLPGLYSRVSSYIDWIERYVAA